MTYTVVRSHNMTVDRLFESRFCTGMGNEREGSGLIKTRPASTNEDSEKRVLSVIAPKVILLCLETSRFAGIENVEERTTEMTKQ